MRLTVRLTIRFTTRFTIRFTTRAGGCWVQGGQAHKKCGPLEFTQITPHHRWINRSKGPGDVFDPWVRWERGQVGI